MIDITVGFTRTTGPDDYVPAYDGYRPGAAQLVFVLEVPDGPHLTAAQWAQAVFVATNLPGPGGTPVGDRCPGADAIRHVLASWGGGVPYGWRALTVGDTVTVGGEVYACMPVNFTPVPAAGARAKSWVTAYVAADAS